MDNGGEEQKMPHDKGVGTSEEGSGVMTDTAIEEQAPFDSIAPHLHVTPSTSKYQLRDRKKHLRKHKFMRVTEINSSGRQP